MPLSVILTLELYSAQDQASTQAWDLKTFELGEKENFLTVVAKI